MILIGADFVPSPNNIEFFKSGNAGALFGDNLMNLLDAADFRIFNLETPLYNQLTPIQKCGANFLSPTDSVNGYIAAKTDLFTLANNHILDQGEKGLKSTCNTLQKAKIDYVGTGDNLSVAAKPYYFDFNQKRVGVYACAEHEFSIAGENTAGANPFDPLYSPNHVQKMKAYCDFAIVLYHGGKEHYQYPSPNLQKTCRKLVESGADLVVCQHSHCIGCEEKYQNGTVVYGQGNFLFNKSSRELWKTSLLVCVNDDFSVTYIPLRADKIGVRLAEGEEADNILDGFFNRSEQIKENGFIEQRFSEFSDELFDQYILSFHGKLPLYFRVLNRLLGNKYKQRYIKKKYSKHLLNAVLNFTECEAHREVIINGLKNHIEKFD